jgi:hypothetical protein
MPGKGRFGAAGQATPIDIKHLKAGLIVVPKALTVLAIHAIHRVLHLLHILGGAGIQGVLHHRLLGTAAPSEGPLQGRIGSKPRIDLYQSMSTCQQADPRIVEFVGRPIFDRLLGNPHLLLNRLKHFHFLQFQANSGRTSTACKCFRGRCGRFVHDDVPPIATLRLFDRYGASSLFWQGPFLWFSATTWGQI